MGLPGPMESTIFDKVFVEYKLSKSSFFFRKGGAKMIREGLERAFQVGQPHKPW